MRHGAHAAESFYCLVLNRIVAWRVSQLCTLGLVFLLFPDHGKNMVTEAFGTAAELAVPCLCAGCDLFWMTAFCMGGYPMASPVSEGDGGDLPGRICQPGDTVSHCQQCSFVDHSDHRLYVLSETDCQNIDKKRRNRHCTVADGLCSSGDGRFHCISCERYL